MGNDYLRVGRGGRRASVSGPEKTAQIPRMGQKRVWLDHFQGRTGVESLEMPGPRKKTGPIASGGAIFADDAW